MNCYRNLFPMFTLASAFITSFSANADGIIGAGHYIPGANNLSDFTIVDNKQFSVDLYSSFYSADTLIDSKGQDVFSNSEISTTLISARLLWVTDKQLLGGRYAFSITPGLQWDSLETEWENEDNNGLSDLFIQPLWLGWLDDLYDLNIAMGFHAPVGGTDLTRDFWTTQLQGSVSYYLQDRSIALVFAALYEKHSESDSTKVTPGSHFTFEYGVNYVLTPKVKLGVRGYSQWQTSTDQLTTPIKELNSQLDLSIGDESEVHAIGLSAEYQLMPQLRVVGQFIKEYSAKADLEGELFTVNLKYTMID